jgi:integrase
VSVPQEIRKVGVRTGLEPRREPYWGPELEDDLTLGFRKIDAARGTWIARMRNEAGTPRYSYKSLGLVTDQNDYEVAKAAARKWREGREAGIPDEVVTVADACREYVAECRREGREKTAHDAQRRFERTIYGRGKQPRAPAIDAHPIGRRALAKLHTAHIKDWRDGLGIGKAAANRTLTTLRAALNLAVSNRRVHAGAEREWADVQPYKAATTRRDLFLDMRQRRALIEAAPGATRDLLEGAALTGARAGELVNALRSQFDPRMGSMSFVGKTGRRDVRLSPAALTLFKRLAKNKLPGARLFVRDDGKPWAHSDWDERVREAAKKAKLPEGVCLYTLRHSYISQALSDGIPTLDVARHVGTSLLMIEKHYGHLVAGAAHERMAAVKML